MLYYIPSLRSYERGPLVGEVVVSEDGRAEEMEGVLGTRRCRTTSGGRGWGTRILQG